VLDAPTPPEPDLASAAPKIEGLKAGIELAKQIITLSTGMVALTVTFLKDIVSPDATAARHVPLAMAVAWFAYVIAILAALLGLMAISGTLTHLDRIAMKLPRDPAHAGAYDIYGGNIRLWMSVMCAAFLLAIGLTVLAAALS
jgi:hypothetical protein